MTPDDLRRLDGDVTIPASPDPLRPDWAIPLKGQGMTETGPNWRLPPLSIAKARSTIPLLILVLLALKPVAPQSWQNALNGISEEGALTLFDEVVALVDNLLAALAPIWLWLERRAPNRRLTLTGV